MAAIPDIAEMNFTNDVSAQRPVSSEMIPVHDVIAFVVAESL